VWGIPFPQGGLAALPLGFSEGTDLIFRNAGPSNPGPVWYASPVEVQGLIISGETSILGMNGRYFAVGKDGKFRWSFQTGGSASMSPAVCERTGLVYAGSSDGKMHALDLFSGALKGQFLAAGGFGVSASTDGVRVFLPSPSEGLLYALDAVNFNFLWSFPTIGPFPNSTPAIAGNKVIWNTGDEVVALNAPDGSVLWRVPVAIGGSSVVVGNGYAWGVGMGRLVAIRLSDGHVAQDKEAPLVTNSYIAPILVNAAGGEIVLNAGGNGDLYAAAFASSALPLAPQNLKVEPSDYYIDISWDEPPPVPDDDINEYDIHRREAEKAKAEWRKMASTPGNTRAYRDWNVGPRMKYQYAVGPRSSAGLAGPRVIQKGSKSILYIPSGTAGKPGDSNQDWLEWGFDETHSGWNPNERLSYGQSLSGTLGAWTNRFEFSGKPYCTGGSKRFTEPVVSRGVAYVGCSDGRLYVLNARTGSLIDYVATCGPIRQSPAVSQGGYGSWPNVNLMRYETADYVVFASDDGFLYSAAFNIDQNRIVDVNSTPTDGIAMSPPRASGEVLVKAYGGDKFKWLDVSGKEIMSIPAAGIAGCFLGPEYAGSNAFFNTTDGSGYVILGNMAKVNYPPGAGHTKLELARPSGAYAYYKTEPPGNPYQPYTPLTVGFTGGWWSLLDNTMGLLPGKPSWLWIKLATGPRGQSPGGGLIIPNWSLVDYFGSEISYRSYDLVVGENFDGPAELVSDYPSWCGTTSCSNCGFYYGYGFDSEMAGCMYCSCVPNSLPSMLVYATEDDGGNLPLKTHVDVLYDAPSAAVVSNGHLYKAGDKLVAQGWAAPLAPRAMAVDPCDDISGPETVVADGVNLVWIKPPGYDATGYEILWCRDCQLPYGDYKVVGTITGGDNCSFFHDRKYLAGEEIIGKARYAIRAISTIEARQPGAVSLPVKIEEAIPGAISLSVDPLEATLQDVLVATAIVATGSLGGTSYGLPIPGVEVRFEEVSGSVLMKASPESTSGSLYMFSTLTNSEGVARAYLYPVAASGLGQITARAKWWACGVPSNFMLKSEPVKFEIDGSITPIAGIPTAGSFYFPAPGISFDYEIYRTVITTTQHAYMVDPGVFFVCGQGETCETDSYGHILVKYTTQETTNYYAFGVEKSTLNWQFLGGVPLCQGTICSIPVNTRSGNIMLGVSDLELPSRGSALVWVRSYNSIRPDSSPQGYGWSMGYGNRLEVRSDGAVIFHRWDGATFIYSKDAYGNYVSPVYFHDSLTRLSEGGFKLREREGVVMLFDPVGRLMEVTSRMGNSQRFEYRGSQLIKISDGLGQFISVSYDSKGRIAIVADSTGRQVSYEYSKVGDLIGVKRPGGEQAKYSYDSAHHLLEISDPALREGAKRGKLAYDGLGRVSAVYDGDGQLKHSLSYEHFNGHSRTTITQSCCGPRTDEYDERGLLVSQTDATGHITRYEWDDSVNLTKKTDRNGHETHIEYNGMGRPITVTDALGNQTHTGYENTYGLPVSVADALGRTTFVSYDASGNPVRVTDAAGGVWRRSYDGYGRLREAVDAKGNSSRVGYDALSNISSVTDALGRSTQFDYDAEHRLTRRTDAKGRSTTYSYDIRDRLIATTLPDGAVSRNEYDDWNRQVRAIDPLGNAAISAYDRDDRLLSVTDANNAMARYKYDVQGNLLSRTDPLGKEWRNEYDSLNRQVKGITPLGQITQREYDAEGNVLSTTDPMGYTTHYSYDFLDRLASMTDARNGITRLEYDAVGNTEKEIDANGHETKLAYDFLNRRIEVRDPLDRPTKLAYDSLGNLIEMTDARGLHTTYIYDAASQLLSRKTAEGEDRYEHDLTGNVIKAENGNWKAEYQFDQMDRLTSVIYPAFKKTISHEYDFAGRMIRVVYPEGEFMAYGYDLIGRLITATDSKAGTMKYIWDLAGRKTRQEYPNGIIVGYEYDQADRLLSILPEGQDKKGTPSIRYTYDSRDNRLTMDRSDVGISKYTYDETNQLVKAELPWNDMQEYKYDPVGNRLELSDWRGTQWYKYDVADQLLEIESTFNPEKPEFPGNLTASASASDASNPVRFKTAFSYDQNGNEITKTGPGNKTRKLAFDTLNRLTRIESPGSVSRAYGFDPSDERISIDGGESSRFLRVGTGRGILAELDKQGKIKRRYLMTPGGQLLARVDTSDNKPSWHHFDALGSTVAMTDGKGKTSANIAYDPFGAPRSRPETNERFLFVGQEWVEQDVSGLMHMGAREYSENGRFITKDPLGVSWPLSISGELYIYAWNNPGNLNDPEGLFARDSSYWKKAYNVCTKKIAEKTKKTDGNCTPIKGQDVPETTKSICESLADTTQLKDVNKNPFSKKFGNLTDEGKKRVEESMRKSNPTWPWDKWKDEGLL